MASPPWFVTVSFLNSASTPVSVSSACGTMILSQPNCHRVICFCLLSAPSCRYLWDAFFQNNSLTHLSLRNNHLGDEGVTFLSVALCHSDYSLQSLDLSECSFTAEGYWVLTAGGHPRVQSQCESFGLGEKPCSGWEREWMCEVLKCWSCSLNTWFGEMQFDFCLLPASLLRSQK